jgi:hypothetical protein
MFFLSDFFSNLKDIARQIGQTVPSEGHNITSSSATHGNLPPDSANPTLNQFMSRQNVEQTIINSLSLSEAWDILDLMKKLVMESENASTKGSKIRTLLETHPQIISAIYEIEVSMIAVWFLVFFFFLCCFLSLFFSVCSTFLHSPTSPGPPFFLFLEKIRNCFTTACSTTATTTT